MKYHWKTYALVILVLTLSLISKPIVAQELPHLQNNKHATQLMVDGEPYIILGGELHNSSTSNMEYMSPKWKKLKDMNLNTLLAVVSWQQVEPEEGEFDFSLVDRMLESAREHDLKLILLWFGSWKNGLSHYVPEWVKKDQERFPRIRLNSGKPTETITALSKEARNADAKAYAAFLEHLAKVDSKDKTVIMIQLENEVGVLGAPRDMSELANTAFSAQVPTALINGLKKYHDELQPELKASWAKSGNKENGSWKAIFGGENFAQEAFMAWNYASYMNTIAAAGKAKYDLPVFVNAWIVQPEDIKPGDYPAGGPQSHVHDIWRIASPNIDLYCPDIYLPDFSGITGMYTHSWNPLFVPESFSGYTGASNAFFVVGARKGIGYSPFGIDGKIEAPSESDLAKAYDILEQLTPEITKAQAEDRITAFSLDLENKVQTMELGGYTIEASLPKNLRSGKLKAENGYGLIIWKGEDEFTIAGSNATVYFVPKSPGPKMAGFVSIFEGEYINGKWKAGRLLNGDKIMVNYDLANEAIINRTGTAVQLANDPVILRAKLYRFE
ncbi:DUF5597 domain-containing protein [Echinicola jeungdonensis]|uniref:DUF5597 domain-containing protein n=1 Tax=Echinicola jeungdonensis TaxID=709343 RepID=A0ABV5JAA5_9BACT|nr:DUF5597 domain-containing protein [Echinicola jeungdonensis]MDN3669501.1 DUF5597 domain-containing protein [Echinicola jeungdonensis]